MAAMRGPQSRDEGGTRKEVAILNRRDRQTVGTDGRAQLLLTGAFVISVLLVALALILNSAIFAENLGSRESNGGEGHSVVQYRADVESMANASLRRVNREDNASHAELRRNLSHDVARWSALAARHEAVAGASMNASLRGTSNVTMIRQPSAREMTNASGVDDWQVIDGTSDVRKFEITVNRSSLANLTANESDNATDLEDAGAYRINVSADADRRVFVYENESSGDVVVAAESEPGTLAGTCTTSGSLVTVNLTASTVENASCDPLQEVNATDAKGVRYAHGSNASGTYSLTIDGNFSVIDEADYDENGDGPFVGGRIVAAEIGFTYVSPSITYRTVFSVEPGDADD